MKIDIHTHCKWSKPSELSPQYLQDMLDAAGEHLDVLALTEHFNTVNFDSIYDCLDEIAVYEAGHYRYKELMILPGIEVDVAEGAHIVVIGELAAVRMVSQALNPYRSGAAYIGLAQLLALCEELDCVAIGAHPFREENSLYQISGDLLRRLDALDLNGRDLYKYGLQMEKRVKQLAEQLELPVIAGSDTHHLAQYGCVYNTFTERVTSTAELRQALRSRSFHYTIAADLPAKVQLAGQEQKKIKQAGSYGAAEKSTAVS